MNFMEAGRRYVVLRDQLINKLISQEDFVQAVGELVVAGPDGKMWKLEPFAGTWLEMEPVGNPVSSAHVQTGEPQNLLQLIAARAGSLVKNLPRILPIGLPMASFTWAAYTYTIARIV